MRECTEKKKLDTVRFHQSHRTHQPTNLARMFESSERDRCTDCSARASQCRTVGPCSNRIEHTCHLTIIVTTYRYEVTKSCRVVVDTSIPITTFHTEASALDFSSLLPPLLRLLQLLLLPMSQLHGAGDDVGLRCSLAGCCS